MKRYRLFALLGLVALPLTCLAADDLVRVEVLVFKHLNGQSDAWPVERLEDFSTLLDPRQRALLAAWTARYRSIDNETLDESDPTESAGADWQVPDTDASGQVDPQRPPDRLVAPDPAEPALESGQTVSVVALNDAQPGPVWPELFVHDGSLSGPMQRARDRLSNSPGHEVLSVTSWLQPLDRRSPAPALRVRDDTPISIDWLTSAPVPYAIDPGLNAPELLPQSIYRLDGSVRIRQRQFRHAELDLVWSERSKPPHWIAPASHHEFEVHRLRQSRPIQLGRVEYFDSPWIGVLIRIETWNPPEPVAAGGR